MSVVHTMNIKKANVLMNFLTIYSSVRDMCKVKVVNIRYRVRNGWEVFISDNGISDNIYWRYEVILDFHIVSFDPH